MKKKCIVTLTVRLNDNQKLYMPWLVWLSGWSARLWTKGSPVRFLVRAHAWVVSQIPSRGCMRGNHTLMFLSLSPWKKSKGKKKKLFWSVNSNSGIFSQKEYKQHAASLKFFYLVCFLVRTYTPTGYLYWVDVFFIALSLYINYFCFIFS